MTYFWIIAALLVAGGLVFVVPPLWGPLRTERALAAGAALLFPLLVGGIYFAVGTPAALSPTNIASADNAHAISEEQILAMAARLAERMRQNPEDADGWIMLARTYGALGRFADASVAYERAVQRLPNDARLLADYADVAAMAQERSLQGKPETLIRRALAVDPKNVKALSLSGTVAFEKGDYAGASAEWRKILAVVPAGSDIERSVRASISEAEERAKGDMAAKGAPAQTKVASVAKPAVEAKAASDAKAAPAADAKSAIEGSVKLASALASRVRPDDAVFVFARVPGERMPLAMVRRRAAELPLDFRLDDSMAMNPEIKLSRAKEVEVVARVSRSGNAMPQAGDLEGTSTKTRPGARGVTVQINAAR